MIRVSEFHGNTSPSTRTPPALLGRWLAGELVGELAADYDMSDEQVRWGIEIALWRRAIEGASPRTRRAILDRFNQMALNEQGQYLRQANER